MQEELLRQGGSCEEGRRLAQVHPLESQDRSARLSTIKDTESLLFIHFREKASSNGWFVLQLPKRVLGSPLRQRLRLASRRPLTFFS